MMKNLFLMIVCGLLTWQLNGQVIPPIHCTSATSICDSVEIQDTIKVAKDTTADEIGPTSCLFFGEIRGTWYTFGVNDTGNLRFTITPFDTLTDFDWALYRVDWANCTDIFSVPSYEVRCDASGIGGGNFTTGASGLVQQGHQPAVHLTTPALFYLYVTTSIQDTDAVLGYTIDFSASSMDLVPCNEIGIEEEGEMTMRIYPNPVEDILNIQLNSPIGNTLLRLYDINGRNVLVEPVNSAYFSINIAYLVPGVYVLEIVSDQGISRKKIIKK